MSKQRTAIGDKPRVKLVPLKSTWTCPNCQYQNTYQFGVVSRGQDTCAFCHTQVIPGAIRESDAIDKGESKEVTLSETGACLLLSLGCAIILAGAGIGIAAIIWVILKYKGV